MKEPEIKFCPYCASNNLKIEKGVPRCMDCRSVFFVRFFRILRKPAKKKESKLC